jgi:hypothetical protein
MKISARLKERNLEDFKFATFRNKSRESEDKGQLHSDKSGTGTHKIFSVANM